MNADTDKNYDRPETLRVSGLSWDGWIITLENAFDSSGFRIHVHSTERRVGTGARHE